MELRGETYHIKRVREGDRDAFSCLVDQYSDMVYTICLRMLSVEEDARDAAQEVFLKAYRSLRGFHEKAKFSTWLYRIAYNHCISEIRKRVKVIDLVDEFQGEPEVEEDLTGMDLLSSEERKSYLQSALDSLPETDGVVVTLFYYDELSLEEIAEVTGLTGGNIRVRLHRSRKKLYKVLSEQLKSELNSII